MLNKRRQNRAELIDQADEVMVRLQSLAQAIDDLHQLLDCNDSVVGAVKQLEERTAMLTCRAVLIASEVRRGW